MSEQFAIDQDRTAVVADVGRHAIRVGLTNVHGALIQDSVRSYDAGKQPTVSGAISTFGKDAGLMRLPRRIGIAVAGVSRGDTVAVTNGQWRVSRSGLAAMLQSDPLILNDFAATAWAVSSSNCSGHLETLGHAAVRPQDPGTFCIVGIGSGLGVAAMSRDVYGNVTISPTEAGNAAFPSGLPEAAPLLESIGARHGYATCEMLVSEPGLIAIYAAVAKRRGATASTSDPKRLIRLGLAAQDRVAEESIAIFVKALWHLVGNLVLSCGGWDGIILTGSVASALRPLLERPDLEGHLALNGAYKRALATTPRSLITFRHAELEGTAVALLAEDARKAFSQHSLVA